MAMAGLTSKQPRSERDVLRVAIDELRRHTPPHWTLEVTHETRHHVDALLHLNSPDGARAVFLVEAKTVVEARDIPQLTAQLASWTQAVPGSIGMVVTRYLAKPVQERLADAGLSYADATGNILIRASTPGLYVANQGADQDPWRGPGRPRGTLKGEPAAKVVRALLDEACSWKVTDLLNSSAASTGSVYRVLKYLEAEALTVRDVEGRIEVPHWTALLRRWSQDYQFVHTNTVSRWIAPRGLDNLLSQIQHGEEDDYAITGTIAAAEYAAYAPARNAMIYVADSQRAALDWKLRPADAGINVLLAEPAYPFLLTQPVTTTNELKIVRPAQIAVDLMTGPGRSPAEAEELLSWMETNEQSWRQ